MRDKLEKQLEDSWYVRRPMKAVWEDSAEYRWQRKPVLSERKISLMECFDRIRLTGHGHFGLDRNRTKSGEGSVFVDFAAEKPVQNPSGRAYTEAQLQIPFAGKGEDITCYNRISFWVYVDAPGSACNFLTIALHNAGPKVMPVPGRFEGSHSIMAESGRWLQVIWEIPHVARNCITAFTITSQAYGTSVPARPRIRIFYDDLRLETVLADHDKGFSLRPDGIAYCHSGYRSGLPKQALIRGKADGFSLYDEKGSVVYEGQAEPVRDGFRLLDFTDFEEEGWYRLRAGELTSGMFPVGREAYLSAAWKTLNFFFTQRCGFDVPGVHTECHLDVMSVHPDGRQKCVAGGWHDAGDLTQDSKNTAESALALLELYMAAGKGEKWLGRRALEEARWGIDWMLRARWGDGYTHCGRIIGFWTGNVVGDCDDLKTPAENRPHNNLLTAGVFARAAAVLGEEDPMFGKLCEKCAREDYYYGVDAMYEKPAKAFSTVSPFLLHAQAALAAAELYLAFGDSCYLEDGVRFAKIVMNCQQQEVPGDFSIPLCGYFYESESRERVQAWFHRSYEHVPIRALVRLCEAAPDHKEAEKWRQSLLLYAGYLKRIVQVTPYGVAAAGIYELNNTDTANLYHEGDRTLGAPTMEEYNEQVKNGIRLDETHYLRIFPVAYQFRGFHAPIMGKAIAAMEIHRVMPDETLCGIAVRQMEWILGYNPFACSSMYGEGYDFHPFYAGVEPQIVGAVPVGFECYENEDEPYYPVQNLPTYKEIWVHTTCRLMRLIAYLGFGGDPAGGQKGGHGA